MNHQKTIASLRKQLLLHQQDLNDARVQIDQLKSKLDEANNTVTISTDDYSLDKKYWQILEMIQYVDYFSNLVDPNIGQSLKLLLNQTMELYGYEFVDYSEDTKDYYICERQPLDEVKVTSRALKKNDGSLALEGKAFIPEI